MHPQSSRPCIRAKLLSALKLSGKGNRDLEVTLNNTKCSKANVKPMLDRCDPLLTALARSNNTVTSHRYARQRSTKVPIRVPAEFPINHNFSQRLICSFEDTKEEDKDILALEHGLQTRAKVMRYLDLVIDDLPSPVSRSEDDLLDWLLSTSITQPEEEKNSKTRTSNVLGPRYLVPSSCDTLDHSQSAGSNPYSYLPTPPLTSSSTGRSHHSNKAPSTLTWTIPRPSRLKRF